MIWTGEMLRSPGLGNVKGNNHDNWRMQSMTSAVAIRWDSQGGQLGAIALVYLYS